MGKVNLPQFLDSLEADFEKMTWTFGLHSNSEVGAGQYAIVYSETYNKMASKLSHAERLLSHLLEKPDTPLAPADRERVESFFDPEPL